MATNTPTTLGNLEFFDIKSSLTDFLKNQSTFSGYNFEGSAMQSIIELLAYNTFYYAYYANMINAEAFLDSAQKEDSIISLTKPLGYTVPSKKSAKAKIVVSGLGAATSIAAGTAFSTSNENGTPFVFYNLDNVNVLDGVSDEFYIYEALSYVQFDAIPTFDYDTQTITIADEDFDIDSIKITTLENDVEYIWTRVSNIGYVSQSSQRIYFIERTSNGFKIQFGSNNSLGREISETEVDQLFVRYITCSGTSANFLSVFTTTPGTVTLKEEASGGLDGPDLLETRFVAPKWFASQERAVTVNDYKALLIESGFFSSENDFSVFGGQELSPPRYGRVFITSNVAPASDKINEFINFLRDKSIITVYPEYLQSTGIDTYVDFSFRINGSGNRASILNTVKSIFNQNYAVQNQYNVSFSSSDFIEEIQADPTINNSLIISPDDFFIYAQKDLSAGSVYSINLQNELYVPLFTRVDVTDNFKSDLSPIENSDVALVMYLTSNSSRGTKVNLELWTKTTNGAYETKISGDFGYFIANSGVIYIKEGIIKDTAKINVQFKKKNFTIGLNNLVSLNYRDITVI
jgi:hypothetical protein